MLEFTETASLEHHSNLVSMSIVDVDSSGLMMQQPESEYSVYR